MLGGLLCICWLEYEMVRCEQEGAELTGGLILELQEHILDLEGRCEDGGSALVDRNVPEWPYPLGPWAWWSNKRHSKEQQQARHRCQTHSPSEDGDDGGRDKESEAAVSSPQPL